MDQGREEKNTGRINKRQWSWILYDLGNSAYSITITAAILPIFFKSLTEAAGIAANRSTAYWGYSVSIATLLVAVLAPILGSFLVGIVSQISGSSKYGVLSIGILLIIGFILLLRTGNSQKDSPVHEA